MGICAKELVEYVIRPTLEQLGAWSVPAEQLLLGTAAQETGLGYHVGSQASGCGIYRIDASTHEQVWDQYLAFRPDFASAIRGLASQKEFLNHPHAELSTNLAYATAVAWAIYCWRGAQLGSSTDLLHLGELWKSCFDSRSTSCPDEFAENYQRHVGPEPIAYSNEAPLQDTGLMGGHFAV